MPGLVRCVGVWAVLIALATGTADGGGAVVQAASQHKALTAMASFKPGLGACKSQPLARPGSWNKSANQEHPRFATGRTNQSSRPGQSF